MDRRVCDLPRLTALMFTHVFRPLIKFRPAAPELRVAYSNRLDWENGYDLNVDGVPWATTGLVLFFRATGGGHIFLVISLFFLMFKRLALRYFRAGVCHFFGYITGLFHGGLTAKDRRLS